MLASFLSPCLSCSRTANSQEIHILRVKVHHLLNVEKSKNVWQTMEIPKSLKKRAETLWQTGEVRDLHLSEAKMRRKRRRSKTPVFPQK
jgi:hypothetical protein